jgi:bacillaene synthase trans-acting acyltransferase
MKELEGPLMYPEPKNRRPFVPSNTTVFMFSGQGSQYFQMGKELFETDNTFRNWMRTLDEMARSLLGQSILDTLYWDGHGKADRFDRTTLTHPAIFMVQYSLAQSLIHSGVKPDLVLGVSLGSFAAATVAGFIDVGDAMAAVASQAVAIEKYCEPGGMVAVLADSALFSTEFLTGLCELVSVNLPSHFVVSAKQAALLEIEANLKARNISYQRIPVCFAFHSQWIDRAKAAFLPSMASISCRRGQLPLVCCDQMATLSDLPAEYFWNVVRRPIRFRETTEQLERRGAYRYIDVGPAGTLATFLKYGMPVASKSTVHPILTPFGFGQKIMEDLLPSIKV